MIDAILQAGPAIRRTNAAPGERPFNIKAAAIGMEPVAQTYIGTETASTISIVSKGLLITFDYIKIVGEFSSRAKSQALRYAQHIQTGVCTT